LSAENGTTFNFPVTGKSLVITVTTLAAAGAGWFGTGIYQADAGAVSELQAMRDDVDENVTRLERKLNTNQRSNDESFAEIRRVLGENGRAIHDLYCFIKKQENVSDEKCGLMGLIPRAER